MSSDQTAGAVARTTSPIVEAVLRPVLSRLDQGALTITLPSGATLRHKGNRPGPHGHLVIHRWRALRKLVTHGDAGFAAGYVAGDWSSADLTAVLELAARNMASLEAGVRGSAFARAASRLRHWGRANSRAGSRKNIAFHYDLGNDFYRSWLDASMTYSSALYAAPGETLEDAQARKIGLIASLLELRPDHDLLEIGCGWGTLALALAPRCRSAHGITLSARQFDWCARRVAEERLADKVSFAICDYRDVEGAYDRIVSIEMIEAVGEAYWPAYFRTIHDRLKPGGVAVVQAITIDEDHFESYRRKPDFIQQQIFPGGMLLTASAIRREAAAAGLHSAPPKTFGASYALTLAEWRRRFFAARETVARQGFPDEFMRLWDYYLSYCEGGFRAGLIDVGLYVLRRPA